MYLLVNGTQGGTTVPAPQAAVGTPGYANSGTPGSVTPTILDPDNYNTVLAELAGFVTSLGITLNRTSNAQLLQAVKRMGGGNYQAYTTATTLTADQAGLVVVNGAAGGFTLTLPAANSAGGVPLRFDFARTDSTTSTVAVQTAGSDTFFPGGDVIIGIPLLGRISYVSDGVSKWYLQYQSAENGGVEFLYGDGSFTVPNNVTRLLVEGVGGGGGGAGCNGTYAGGGGGSGGAFRGLCEVTPGQVISATIGAAGAAGAGATSGGTGGTTSFGSFVQATGGTGGAYSATAPIGGGPGLGSTSNSSFVGGVFYGGFGEDAIPGVNTRGGAGAASIYGGGVKASRFFAAAAQSAAPGSGGGGGEGPSSVTASNGLSGLIIVSWGLGL